MTPLGSRIDRCGGSEFEVVFLDAGTAHAVTLDSLWSSAVTTGRRLEELTPSIAAVLDNTASSVRLVLACLASHTSLVSLPAPYRTQDPTSYATWLVEQTRVAGCSLLALPAGFVETARTLGVDMAVSTEDVLAAPGPASTLTRPDRTERGATPFGLVQYTSGTTSHAKGVCFDWDLIERNVDAIHRWIRPGDRESVFSWLPLSHDMGLVGGLLASLLAAEHGRGSRLVLGAPDDFVRDPSMWFRACSEFDSTITMGPDFGYRMAAQRTNADSLDLSRLRVCISGAEPPRQSTLAALIDRFGGAGWNPHALTPAYGFAEAGLAVSAMPISEPPKLWTGTELVDACEAANRGVRSGILSSGVALAGTSVRIERDESPDNGTQQVGGPGVVHVRSSSLAQRYLDGTSVTRGDGGIRTSDLGVVTDGWLAVLGRLDDSVSFSGVNIAAGDVEAAISDAVGVRPGSVALTTDADGELCALIEARGRLDAGQRFRARAAAKGVCGLAPARIVDLGPARLPRTPSGKLRRHDLPRLADSRTNVQLGKVRVPFDAPANAGGSA